MLKGARLTFFYLLFSTNLQLHPLICSLNSFFLVCRQMVNCSKVMSSRLTHFFFYPWEIPIHSQPYSMVLSFFFFLLLKDKSTQGCKTCSETRSSNVIVIWRAYNTILEEFVSFIIDLKIIVTTNTIPSRQIAAVAHTCFSLWLNILERHMKILVYASMLCLILSALLQESVSKEKWCY